MVSLADLRARGVVPAWQEAVAVVQELIHASAQTQGRDAPLPDVAHIALIANGEVVSLPGSRSTGHPVRQAAVLLDQLLDGAAAPPELLALVADNATETPKLPSLAELTRQLAFFERPGRRSDVEALVARAMSADAQSRAEDELRRLKERTLVGADLDAFQSEDEIAEAKNQEPRTVNRQLTVVLALVVAVALAGGGWWVYARVMNGGAPGDAAAPSVAAVESPAAPDAAAPADPAGGQPTGTSSVEPAGEQASTGEPSFLQRTGASIRRVVESAFGPGTASEAAPAKSADAGGIAADATAPGAAAPAASRSRGRRSSSTPTPSPAAAAPSEPPAEPPAEPPQVSTTVSRPPIAGDPMSVGSLEDARSIVYSRKDDDVRPAVLLRPVLPAEPPPDVPPDQIGTLELIVDEYGDVEQVRLISPANRFHERMLVAHAKSWKFRPAIRDGRPVKYRTVIRLTI